MSRIGILLLQLGGPDTPEAIRPFLHNLFADRDLIQLPGGAWTQGLFASMISRSRSRKVSRYYDLIGGASPLTRVTEAQALGLETELAHRGWDCPVAVAMRYWHPFTGEALTRLAAADVQRLVVISLYPQFSWATTGSSLNELMRELAKQRLAWPITVVQEWHEEPLYLDALATRLRATVESLGEEAQRKPESISVLWSAHGLPQSFIDRGDPYARQIEATVAGVMSRVTDLGLPHRLGYQSRSGPVTWIGPGTEEIIAEEYHAGRRQLIFVPVSFVSDHLETLYEIDMLFGDQARSIGYESVLRVPSFNDDAELLHILARLTEERLAYMQGIREPPRGGQAAARPAAPALGRTAAPGTTPPPGTTAAPRTTPPASRVTQ